FSDGEFFDSPSELQGWISKQKNFSAFSFLCGKGSSPVPKFNLSGPYPGAISNVHPDTLHSLASSEAQFFDLSEFQTDRAAQNVAGAVQEIVTRGEEEPQYQFYLFLFIAFLLLILYQMAPLKEYLFARSPARFVTAVVCLAIISLSMSSPQ